MLDQKSVLITGGGSGVGKRLALTLAEHGASVVIAGRTESSLSVVTAMHDNIQHAVVDVTDESSVDALFSLSGAFDIVIANAGASAAAPLHRIRTEDWSEMIAVNLTGAFLTLRAGLQQMRDKDWGRLIAVASTAGLKGYAYTAHYTAAKHGVVGLVRATAQEIARTGITINAICPGFLDTEMTQRSIQNIMASTGRTESEAIASLTAFNPQQRLIQPDEVVAAALWLCSEHSQSVNGAALPLAGGEV